MSRRTAPGDLAVVTGAVLFLAGLVAVVLGFGPFVYAYDDAPGWLQLLGLLVPAGLAVAAYGVSASGRGRGAARSSSRTGSPGDPAPRS